MGVGRWEGGWEGFLWLGHKNQKCNNPDLVEKTEIHDFFTMEVVIRPKVVKHILKILTFSDEASAKEFA